MQVTRELAKFVSGLTFETLPLDVIHKAKLCILDLLGVTLSGSKEQLVDILLEVAAGEGGNPRASIIGRSMRAPLLHAALINGSSSHALDFDDVHAGMMGHPSAVVLPGLLALGEFKRCSGRDLITAFVAGFETVCHVGLCQTRSHLAQGWHPTATIGHFGAAAACANLLKLDEEKAIFALGLAGTQAAGLKQVFGTMGKPFNAGKASMNGLLAALLAEKGFTSSYEIIEGDMGFTKTFTPKSDLAGALNGLGVNYQISTVIFKKHASCFATHPTIEGALAFREEGLTADDIESVHVFPYHGHYDGIKIMKPKTGLEGKFSIPYTFAVAFVEGKAGENCFTDSAVRDPKVIKVRDKVTMEKDKNMPLYNSSVVVKTNDGRVLKKHVDLNKANKNQDEEIGALKQKFFECGTAVLTMDAVTELFEKIMRIEEIKDIEEVISLCRA